MRDFLFAIQMESEKLSYSCFRDSDSSCVVGIPRGDTDVIVKIKCIGGHFVEIRVDGYQEIREDFGDDCDDLEAAQKVIGFIGLIVNEALDMFSRVKDEEEGD